MTDFKWSVVSVDCLPEYNKTADFVLHVYWVCTGSEDAYQGNFSGSTQLPSGKPPYTPYADLTEEMLLKWSFSVMGDFKAEVEGKVAAQIEDQKVPAIVNPPLPWVPVDETEAESLV